MKKCSKCQITKLFDQFNGNKSKKDGYATECKECDRILKKAYYLAHKEKIIKRSKERHWKNPENRKECNLLQKYGISLIEKNKMLIGQEGCCAICKITLSEYLEIQQDNKKVRDFAIDHNHKTGQIRGLLCDSCNWIIGLCKEKNEILDNAKEYLNYHNSIPLEKSNIIPFKKAK